VTSLPEESPFSAFALATAATALGQAVQVANGNLHPQAVAWLTLSLVACIGAVVMARSNSWASLGAAPALAVAGVGIAAQMIQLLYERPGMYVRLSTAGDFLPFVAGIIIASLLAGAGFANRSWFGPLRIPMLLVVHFLLGVWMIRKTPNPYIDVYFFQRDGLQALLHGINPYSITYPDIYGNVFPFYGPGVSVNGRLTFGFPYPPLSLLMALPGHLLTGDYRYSQLAAMTISGGLMAYSRPGPLAAFAATLFLFTPRIFFVLEQGWTDPLVLVLLAATVFAASRAPKHVALLFGLFLASKQYTFLAVPALALLMPRPFQWKDYARTLGKATLIAVAITLPFFLWNVEAFVRSAITLQLHQPFRADALSYLSWFARGDQHWPTWVAFAAAAVGAGLAVWRGARSPSGFAAGVAMILALFFAFNKQAFCNYYFLVIGACSLGCSALRRAPE